MRKSSQINLRLDPPSEAELTQVAMALGVSKSALVRRLTEAFLAEVKKTGAVKLDPTWVKGMITADARSSWGERKILDSQSPMLNEEPPPYPNPEHQNQPTTMKAPAAEPLTAIILKALGIVSTIAAVVYFVKFCMAAGSPAPQDALPAARAAVEHAGHFYGAVGATASAISLWWMGSVLTLLDRITRNGERTPPESPPIKQRFVSRKELL